MLQRRGGGESHKHEYLVIPVLKVWISDSYFALKCVGGLESKLFREWYVRAEIYAKTKEEDKEGFYFTSSNFKVAKVNVEDKWDSKS